MENKYWYIKGCYTKAGHYIRLGCHL